MKLKRLILIPLLLAVARLAHGADDAGGSAQQFVQSFYNWYVPLSNSQKDSLACEEALNQKPQMFSAKLFRGLKGQTNKQESSAGLVGLGFDPFLNSQDPAPKYAVGNVSRDGDHYLVDVFGVQKGQLRGKADVVAKVKQENGHWVFTDFLYPDGRSLKKLVHAN